MARKKKSELDIKIELIDKFRERMKEKIDEFVKKGQPIEYQVYLLVSPACNSCHDAIKQLKKDIDVGDIVVLETTSELGKKAMKDAGVEYVPEFVIYVSGRFLKLEEFQIVERKD